MTNIMAHRENLEWLVCDMCNRPIAAVFPRDLSADAPDESYICYLCTGYHVNLGTVSTTVEKLSNDPLYPELLREHWARLVEPMKIHEEYRAKLKADYEKQKKVSD